MNYLQYRLTKAKHWLSSNKEDLQFIVIGSGGITGLVVLCCWVLYLVIPLEPIWIMGAPLGCGLAIVIYFILTDYLEFKERNVIRNCENKVHNSQLPPKGVNLSTCGVDNKEETKQ